MFLDHGLISVAQSCSQMLSITAWLSKTVLAHLNIDVPLPHGSSTLYTIPHTGISTIVIYLREIKKITRKGRYCVVKSWWNWLYFIRIHRAKHNCTAGKLKPRLVCYPRGMMPSEWWIPVEKIGSARLVMDILDGSVWLPSEADRLSALLWK